MQLVLPLRQVENSSTCPTGQVGKKSYCHTLRDIYIYICISQIAVGEKPELSILHNPNTKASKEHIMRASAPSAIFFGNPAPNYIHASSLTVQLVNQEQEQTLLF